MSIKDKYRVMPIKKSETYDWLLHKHYAKRIPSISYAFGLYGDKLEGVCTFGPPCRYYNDGEFIFNEEHIFCENFKVFTLELNRLCINDGLDKNILSWFVSNVLKLLPQPVCLVSYSDEHKNHKGYIYQATNWLYTGKMKIHDAEYKINGKEVHSRTLTGRGITAPKEWAEKNKGLVERGKYGEKHRYFYLIGKNKGHLRQMKYCFRFNILPYPKGDNKRYDASYKPKTQEILF